MSILNVQVGCGAQACERRIVAWLYGPDDPGRVPPCPACVEAVGLCLRHWGEDRDRVLRSVNNVIVGRW